MPQPDRGEAFPFEIKPWIAIAAIGLIIAVSAFWIDSYRHRFVRSGPDLVGLLPTGKATLFYVDLSALRQAGVIGVLRQLQFADEGRYSRFLRQTGFDYTKDVDQLAGEIRGASEYEFIGRGRFNWDRLRAYALEHGGSCSAARCQMLTSTPGRWATFSLLQPDVIGLVVSGSARALAIGKGRPSTPSAPIWFTLSPDLLSSPPSRIPVTALSGATSATISAGPAGEPNARDFIVRLDASYPNAQTASIAKSQLAVQTRMLSLQLQRNGILVSPNDVSGLLTSGSFRAAGDRVIGNWRVSEKLLRSLE